ncbi:MAG: hypothetical protein L3K19_06690 [Thermoplasmata archaeon]|nr:hypothetical protein [Thermoplasmata archaeon]
MKKFRASQRGMVSVVMFGLAAMMLVGVIPALSSHGLNIAHTTSGAPSGVPAPAASSGPTVAPFHPLPSHQQQLQMVHPPSHVSLGHFQIKGPHPASWGPSGIPPGSEVLRPSSQGWGGGGGGSGGSSASNWNNRFCAGLWPQFENYVGSSSQGAYASGCYGHDEPGIQFQSDLPGSGGNVTWNVTLPTDRDATHNQSDLYSAIWFGMTMTDPFGWMDQCFLELQFYPDQLFTNPGPQYPNWTVNGKWIGAAVAWQIEAATGFENPCFYEPLYINGVPGPSYLNMTQGDHIVVKMTGYATSTIGERLSIIDKTSGQASNLTMFNTAQGYPINPSYSQSNTEASMQWTPGGEYPVSFAFETGHAGNPTFPSNNSYGGCSGGPVSTPTDPGAPCPSYDPGSWANDSLTPWKISTPTFFNAATTYRPVQVAFTQPEGGMPLVDQTSNGVCSGIEGSAWCSYPYYSYYCGSHVFEFGAVDYTGVASDFGKWHQFNPNLQTLSFGGGFFPPTNFSVPSCGALASTLSIGPSSSGGGSVMFLSHADSSPTSVSGLLRGTYSVHAIPASGMGFSHWTATGGASVDIGTSPYTTLHLTGSGSLRAVFTAHPKLTSVTFRDIGQGTIGLDPNFLWTGSDAALATLTNGQSFSLPPGIYSIQAYPKPGWNFSYWSFGGGVSVPAAQFPYTQLIVTGATSSATLGAWYTPTTTNGTVDLYAIGVGTATFGKLSVTSTSPFGFNFGTLTVRAGTYPVIITPGPGVVSWQILYGQPLIISNNSVQTLANLENGTAILEVLFTSGAQVTFHVNPAKSGTIYAQGPTGFVAVTSGSTQNLVLGTYAMAAAAAPGYAFSGWSTNGSAISFSSVTALTDASVFGNGSVTANFLKTSTTSTLNIRVHPGPKDGTVTYNEGSTYGGGTSLKRITSGQVVVMANPAKGWMFAGWGASGSASLTGPSGSATTVITLASGTGNLVAIFVPTLVPLSFVIWNPVGPAPAHGSLAVLGMVLHSGDTVWLRPGTYTVTLTAPAALSSWSADGGLSIVSSTSRTATLTLGGGGTIEADLS